MPRSLIVAADGGSRGNRGPAGYGAVVLDATTGEVLAEAARAAATALGPVSYAWVPRERNAHADRLANEAMDAAERPAANAGGIASRRGETPSVRPVRRLRPPAGVRAA